MSVAIYTSCRNVRGSDLIAGYLEAFECHPSILGHLQLVYSLRMALMYLAIAHMDVAVLNIMTTTCIMLATHSAAKYLQCFVQF